MHLVFLTSAPLFSIKELHSSAQRTASTPHLFRCNDEVLSRRVDSHEFVQFQFRVHLHPYAQQLGPSPVSGVACGKDRLRALAKHFHSGRDKKWYQE